MMIFNHQVFPSEFARFWPDFDHAAAPPEKRQNTGSAQKRRFIKPNKTESPKSCK